MCLFCHKSKSLSWFLPFPCHFSVEILGILPPLGLFPGPRVMFTDLCSPSSPSSRESTGLMLGWLTSGPITCQPREEMNGAGQVKRRGAKMVSY